MTALAIALAPPAAFAQARLTEGQVRAFVARQEAAWNAGDLDRFFAGYAPRATFTEQALGSDNRLVPYGRSTVAEARTLARRAFARGKVSASGEVLAVAVSADGRGAAMRARVTSRLEAGGRVRTSCAERLQTFALVGGALRSTGQTDTIVRCRR